LCDKTIYVDVTKDKQIENLKSRHEDIENALKLNANFDIKNKKKATYVIINDKDVANLDKQVATIYGK
jgi:dephospho-CoA kinase